MKKIELSSIVPGTVIDADICTHDGELLISKGTTVTQKHLDVMRRRNIYDVYIKLDDEAEELDQLLAKDFGKLEQISFDDPLHPVQAHRAPTIKIKGAMLLPEFMSIKAGQEGFNQLLESSQKAKELDSAMKEGTFSDRPIGPPLKSRAVVMKPSQRSEAYKSEMKLTYSEALDNVKIILNTLADALPLDGSFIKNIVARFVQSWLIDRNILLNITHIKTSDGDYLFHHSLNVCILSINIAAAAGFSEKQIVELGIGAVLHDVGMLLVPKDIFLKKGRLTKDEWYEVQKHPVLGLHLLEKVSNLPHSAAMVAYQTHERENGIGYPKQRTGRFIHNYSKIVQIADIFESLSSPREYRAPYIPYQAMELLIKMSGKKLLSSEFVKAFISYMSLFPVGSMVELSDHSIAKVIEANEFHFTKPIVSVITDSQGTVLSNETIFQVDLSKNQNLQIIKAVEWDNQPNVDIMRGF